ncbi:hypothetical protein [Gilvimarinus agarilyticus]|uniref:hypothetical protein n=1 Tax=Gilvimarinus agarilyticus TaxID=679259 RepID=UPI00059EF5FA|nr:hypothetical protein [Gilvimarinus agarilyticus]
MIKLVPLLCFAWLLAACNGSVDSAGADSSVVSAEVLNTAQVGSVIGKPALPVRLLHPRQRVDVGVVTEVDLSLVTDLPETSFRVSISPDSGLSVVTGSLEQTLNSADTLDAMLMSLEVRADYPGKYYINLEVVNSGGATGLDRRALALVVLAGPTEAKALSAEPKTIPEKRVLPAQERVY